MKMVATPYAFYPYSTSFKSSSALLLLYHEYPWLAIIPESQTEKISNNETTFHASYRSYYTA